MAANERIERLCASGLAAKPLRERLLVELRRAVPFDAHVWLLTDPVTRVGTSPLADVPGLPWSRLPELTRHRYLAPTNRWADLMDAGASVSVLGPGTGAELGAASKWREMLAELGVVDVATMVCWDRFGCWAWLDLWRIDPAPPFSTSDRRFLGAQARTVATGLRRAQAATFVEGAVDGEPPAPAVVVLDPDLQVRHQTAGALRTLQRLNPPEEPIDPIPAAAYNVGAALVAVEQGVPVGPASSRMHVGGGRWLTCRAARIGAGATHAAGPGTRETADVAVTFETTDPGDRLEVFARAHGLSRREREVIGLLAEGLDSHAVAAHLVLSEHTVNDHVKAVLSKTGTRSRQALVSRAIGVARGANTPSKPGDFGPGAGLATDA